MSDNSVTSFNTVYANTLTARYGKDGAEILLRPKIRSNLILSQSYSNPRKLTPRECARLQGFPDSFKIVCSDTQAYKQFGNAVTVNVITAIAKQILIFLLSNSEIPNL